jgi:hypothetical protein
VFKVRPQFFLHFEQLFSGEIGLGLIRHGC